MFYFWSGVFGVVGGLGVLEDDPGIPGIAGALGIGGAPARPEAASGVPQEGQEVAPGSMISAPHFSHVRFNSGMAGLKHIIPVSFLFRVTELGGIIETTPSAFAVYPA